MTSFSQLKQQIESLNSNKSPLNKTEREIFFYEQDLVKNSVSYEFAILLSDLDPENADQVFGPHNYTRKNYQLGWKKVENKFHFVVTNTLANKSVKLRSCPNHLQELVLPLLDNFVALMARNFNKNVEYDESYSLDS